MNNKKLSRKLFTWFIIIVLMASMGGSVWLFQKDARQQELDNALITSLTHFGNQDYIRLLDEGANPNARELLGPRPSAFRLILRFLRLDHTPVEKHEGNSALAIAVLFENSEATKLLLDRGADPNLSSGWPLTLLDHAITRYLREPEKRKPLFKIITALLDHGADPDVFGRNQYWQWGGVARGMMPKEIAALLRKYGAHE